MFDPGYEKYYTKAVESLKDGHDGETVMTILMELFPNVNYKELSVALWDAQEHF